MLQLEGENRKSSRSGDAVNHLHHIIRIDVVNRLRQVIQETQSTVSVRSFKRRSQPSPSCRSRNVISRLCKTFKKMQSTVFVRLFKGESQSSPNQPRSRCYSSRVLLFKLVMLVRHISFFKLDILVTHVFA
ncbi:unnamed protein product [Linum trigynum]|uniref:Uncharacterized protein n=1 Tax=Linum trigynum TaxID=586398 RepID=A0AAV2E3C1_9ROSI